MFFLLTQCNWLVDFDIVVLEELNHIYLLHGKVLGSDMNKNCRLKAVIEQTFGSLGLLGI